MIKPQSDDPDVELAASSALQIIEEVLFHLPKAESFDYGGHILTLGEYDVCSSCTIPIAEAQQASKALLARSNDIDDSVIKEHVELAAKLFQVEADAAVIRAELHNGFGTEKILNSLLGFIYTHDIHDNYRHSHRGGK